MYAGGKFEQIKDAGITKWRLYVDGSPYTASVAVETMGGSTRTYYLHRDNLGSLTHISDESGNLVSEYSYDAWGRLRRPDNWACYELGKAPEMRMDRGYTGHEHLRWLGLIHMDTPFKRA